MGIKCARCKDIVTTATSISLLSHRPDQMVCHPCFDHLMAWREKRGLDRHLRKVKKEK